MTRTLPRRIGIALGAIAVTGTGLIVGAVAQKLTPAEVAARLSGTWTINRELTSGFNAASRRGGRGGGGNFSLGGNAARFGPTASYAQRGGGTGPSTASDMSDLSPAERAEMAAMRELQQLAEVINIKATAEQVAFEDARGQRIYAIDNKNTKLTVAGSEVNTKSRWDKAILRQEFSTPSSKLIQTWEVDENGRLVLTAKVESLRLMTPEQKAVFDKK
jgi:hypothetical protein